jgi:crotonobetaine/carnitine-CoA ligase
MSEPHGDPSSGAGSFGDDPLGVARDPDLVLPRRVAHWATRDPDRPFLQEVTGQSASYGEFHDRVLRWCTWLGQLGVRPGEALASFLPSSIDAHALWLAAGYVGALEVPVNPELRGEFLRHVLADSGVRLCFVRPETAHLIATSGLDGLEVIEVPRERPPVEHLAPQGADRAPLPGDVSCVIYTSGTTGAAKGVIVSWAQMNATIGRIPRAWLSGEDAVYSFLPMFHVTGRSPLPSMADVGGRVVLRERFSMAEFWSDIRRFGCTSTTPGPAIPLSLAQPARDDDARHPLRIALTASGSPQNARFQQRFGVRMVGCYGSTEAGFPIVERGAAGASGHCGWLRPGYAARIVDDQGRDLPDDSTGELLVMPPAPELMTRGYLGRPDLTAKAIVDGWYHTGDAMIRSDDGSFRFVDRMRDTIRRFGENISASAVEAVILEDPEIVECAVVGVPSPISGQEILLALVPADPARFDPAACYARLEEKLARFMRPAFISIRHGLPKTPNGKVLRRLIRDEKERGELWISPAAAAQREVAPRAREETSTRDR